MAEFERLENSALVPLLRLVGTFSDAQRQSAAGCDMFVHCASQAARPEFYAADGGGLDGARYAQKVQLVGVHCWLCHVRLREEPKERYDKLFYEMMEKQWEQVQLDLSRGGPAGLEEGMGFIELSGYLKDLQTGWHGLAVKLDNAIGVGVPKAADGGEAAGGEAELVALQTKVYRLKQFHTMVKKDVQSLVSTVEGHRQTMVGYVENMNDRSGFSLSLIHI